MLIFFGIPSPCLQIYTYKTTLKENVYLINEGKAVKSCKIEKHFSSVDFEHVWCGKQCISNRRPKISNVKVFNKIIVLHYYCPFC